jgi:hypothetical protein
MNRRTIGAGSVVRRLVVLGVLTAFCLVLISSTVSASLHPWGNTPVTTVVKASDDPYNTDKAKPVKVSRLTEIMTRIVVFFGIHVPMKVEQNGGKTSGSAPNTATTR